MIRAVLLDLDDTIFDHRHSSRAALQALHAHEACLSNVSFDDFERAHARFLEELHRDVMLGRIPLEQARAERFRRVYAFAGVEANEETTRKAAVVYRDQYQAARRPIAGAAVLLGALHERVRIGVVSNNLLEEQQEKLRFCGLAPYIDVLIVSEEAGVAKPDPVIFQLALDALGVPAENAVMIGDSWAADILGARAAGIRAVWFNPLGLPRPDETADVTELRALEPGPEVLAIILGEVGARAHRD